MISDMTKGNPLKLILSFSVPMLIGNIFQQVYNFVDAAIVGKFVGAESLAAVGSTGHSENESSEKGAKGRTAGASDFSAPQRGVGN